METARRPQVAAPRVGVGRRGILLAIGGGLVFGFLALYVGVINAAAVRGDDIRDLERRIAQLTADKDTLALREAQLRAADAAAVDQTRFEQVSAEESKALLIPATGHDRVAMH